MIVFICCAMAVADSLLGDYDFPTSNPAISKVAEIINTRRGNFYDLGSARGDFLLKLAKQAPSVDYFGLDNSLFRVYVSRFKALFLSRNITFLHQNIFDADFAKIDTAYIYLEKSLLPKLESKLQAELKTGAMVITNANGFPSWQAEATYITHPNQPQKQQLFVYVKK